MNKEEYAVSLRNQGYNCAQAVICAFADELQVDEKTLFKLSECFGSGLGCTKGTCGALNALCMMVSMHTSTAKLEAPNSKASTYVAERQLVQAFEKEVGGLTCRLIKGIDTGEVLCECEDCVRIAVRLYEEWRSKNVG